MADLVGWSLVYFVLALAAEHLAGGPDGVVTIWPAGGAALYLFLRHGWRGAIPIVVGGLAASYGAFVEPARAVSATLLVAASVIGAAAGAAAYRSIAPTLDIFDRTQRMMAFVTAGALVFSFVTAAAGTLVLYLFNAYPGSETLADMPGRFLPWFIADLTGTVLVTPAIIAWAERSPLGRIPATVSVLWTVLLLAAAVALLAELPANIENSAMMLLLGPAFAAAALKTKPRVFMSVLISGGTLAVVVVATNTLALDDKSKSLLTLLLVQLYVVSISFTHLILYAAISENRRSIAERVNLAKHFSPNMVELIAKLGRPFETPRRQPATVLFCDLRNFTGLSESAGPEATMAMLRAFHGAMSEIIFAHGGTLDRYIGDGLMAVFGVPEPADDDALRAVRCAYRMTEALAVLNTERARHDLPSLEMGIGLHTGDVVLGEIGAENALSVTVVGDTVNAASRLQALSRELSAALVMSDETLRASRIRASENESALLASLEHVGKVHLRGRRQQTDTWALPRHVSIGTATAATAATPAVTGH